MRVIGQGLQSIITYLFVFQVFSATRSVPSISLHLRQQMGWFLLLIQFKYNSITPVLFALLK